MCEKERCVAAEEGRTGMNGWQLGGVGKEEDEAGREGEAESSVGDII